MVENRYGKRRVLNLECNSEYVIERVVNIVEDELECDIIRRVIYARLAA